MLALSVLAIAVAQVTPPDFDSLKSAALTTRRSIRTADVTIKRAINDGSGEGSQKWRIWMDGNKIRGDYTPEPPEPTDRLVHCIGCDRDGWGLYYTEKRNFAADFRPSDTFAQGELFAAVSPKHFGYSLSQLQSSSRVGFEGVFGAPRDGSKSVSIVEHEGMKCWRLSWTTGPKERPVSWTAIVAPEQGGQIVLLQGEGTTSGKPFRETTTSKLKKWGEFWYPESVIFEQTSGAVLATREVSTFHDVKINQPVDPTVFTFKGIKMLSSVPVALPNPKGNGFIRDGKIETALSQKSGVQPASSPPPVPVSDRRYNPWLLAVCAVLSLAAGFLIVKRLRAPRESA